MGLFTKMFGTKDGEKSATGAGGVDMYTALSMHLRGETDLAFNAYRTIAQDNPADNLAPFFASAILAGADNLAEGVETLRNLSRRSSTGGETISRAVARELFTLLTDEPTLNPIAVAEIVVAFGDRLRREGLIQECAVCFEIAAGLRPDQAPVLHRLGDMLHDLGNYDYAESVLRKALECAPNHWDSLYTYAVLLQDLGRVDEAISTYDKAVSLNPDHVKCRNNYGAALMVTNRLDEALAHCTAAAELDPSFPPVWINLGNIHLLKEDYETARTCFAKAISLDKDVAPAYFGLGSIEQCTGGDPGRVRELYRKAVDISPFNPQFHHALGNLLAGEGNPEAMEHFTAAEQLFNTLKDLQRDFGQACLQFGRREEGLEHLRVAVEQNPEDELARELLAKADAADQ